VTDFILVLLAKLLLAAFGLGWFAYHLHRFSKWKDRRTTAPVRFWLISLYSGLCMAFGLLIAYIALTMDLQSI